MSGAGYAWDEHKRIANLDKHGIDFRDATGIFERPHLTIASDAHGETRFVSLGVIGEAVVAVVWTDRGVWCASSPRGLRGAMSGKSTTRASARDPGRGSTDLARIEALTDDAIAAAVADDPDAAPLDIDWSRAEVVVPPRKVPVSIRLDEDVLAYFRDGGAGYQSRINAVLRGYVRARSAGGKG